MRDARDEWIEKEYPAAIFALKVEHERDSANYEVASYAGKAYEALWSRKMLLLMILY